jgi:cation diffusion facilitator family transporter
MHALDVERFKQSHDTARAHEKSERRTHIVLALTAIVMVVELVVGTMSNSLALTADGWHMGTHAGAFTVAAFGYWFARTRAKDARFSFGTGKVYALSGFASAVGLGAVALFMVLQSVERFFSPEPIAFMEALPVAVAGLLVNLASLALLGHGEHGHHDHEHHDHDHDHDHDHEHEHEHDHHDHAHEKRDQGHDHNLRGVYLHVLADAATSVLAIVALAAGVWAGVTWLDPVMGLVGAMLILKWARDLASSSGQQLLDVVPSPELEARIKTELESIDDARVTDLHVWEIGPDCQACIASIVTHTPREPGFYRARIAAIAKLSHVTVEVHACPDERCADKIVRAT